MTKIHFLSQASPRNHGNKGVQPVPLDPSKETWRPKKKKKIVGVQISLSRWEERSDLQFYCPRTTVYMKYSRSGFTPRKGTETEHKLNPRISISKSHLQTSQTLIHLNLFVLHLYLLEPLFLYPPTRL